MKKLVLTLSIATSLALVSCGTSQKEETNCTQDSTCCADSAKVDTTFVLPTTTSTVTVDTTKK